MLLLLFLSSWTGLLLSSVKPSSVLSNISSDNNELLVEALSSAVNQSFCGKVSSLNIISEYDNDDYLNSMLKKFAACFSIVVSINEWTVPRRRYANLLVFRNVASLERHFLLQDFASSGFACDGFYLITLLDEKSGNPNLMKIYEEFWLRYMYNLNVMVVEHGSSVISLKTFLPFSDSSSCRKVKIVTLDDTFDFPKKFHNLFGCPLKLSTFDYPPAVFESEKGHEIDLMRGLAQMLNFTLQVEILNEPAAWGFILENGTSGGVMRKVMTLTADMAIGTYYLTQTRAKFMSFCLYGSSSVILVIPSGVPLTAVEKLFSPFSSSTWSFLLATAMFAIVIIFMLKRQSQIVQNFVFGAGIRDPYLNMLNILMNGSQHAVPRTTFARTLLMMFILFCLVIRTLYQAGMFKSLQSEQRHAELRTIDELIERQFDIYMYDSFQELSRGLKIHER